MHPTEISKTQLALVKHILSDLFQSAPSDYLMVAPQFICLVCIRCLEKISYLIDGLSWKFGDLHGKHNVKNKFHIHNLPSGTTSGRTWKSGEKVAVCKFTKSNALLGCFSRFLNYANGTKSRKASRFYTRR